MKGIPDILGILPGGAFLAIEVKKPKPDKTYPSKEQKAFMKRINDDGGIAFVARDVDTVKKMLKL